MAKPRKRETRYPYHRSISLSAEDGEALEAVADADGIAVGVLLRSAFRRGWPAEREARRKARAKRQAGTEDDDGTV